MIPTVASDHSGPGRTPAESPTPPTSATANSFSRQRRSGPTDFFIPPRPERVDDANLRVTLSSICSDCFASYSSDVSHTSTTSSDQLEIHISQVSQDIGPVHIGKDVKASGPVTSLWQAESLPDSPTPWILHLSAYGGDSDLPPASPLEALPQRQTTFFAQQYTHTDNLGQRGRGGKVDTHRKFYPTVRV